MSDIILVKETAPGTPLVNQTVIYVDTADEDLKAKTNDTVVHILARSTRSLYIPIIRCYFGGEQGGTAPNEMPIGVDVGTLPNQVKAVQLTDALCSGVHFFAEVPIDAVAATLTIRPVWAPSVTDASSHAVAWRMAVKILTGADVTAAGTVITWTGDSAARTANIQVIETGQATTAVTPTAGDTVRVALSRDGGVAADTYVGDVNLLGIRIDYSSSD